MKKYSWIFIFLFFVPRVLLAQLSPKQLKHIDSLKNVIATSKSDTVKVKALFAWDDLIYYFDLQLDSELMARSQKICELNLKHKLSKPEYKFFEFQLGKSLNNLGTYYKSTGNYVQAIIAYEKGLRIMQRSNNERGKALLYNNLGIVYKNQGDFSKAINYYTASLKIFEKLNDKVNVGSTLNNIGTIYLEQHNYAVAMKYFKRCLHHSLVINDQRTLGGTYNNIGVLYQETNKNDTALNYFLKSLSIRKTIGDLYGYSNSLINIGDVYAILGNNKLAIKYYSDALILKDSIDDKAGKSTALNDLGYIYYLENDLNKAIGFSEKSLAIATEIGSVVEIEQASKHLGTFYEKAGKFKLALDMRELYTKMRDSINSENSKKEIVRQEFKYAYEKKALADSVRIAEEKKVSDAKLQQEKTQRYALYGGLALTLIFGIVMFSRFRITRSQKNIIEEQKKIVEKQKELVEEKQKEVMDSIHYAKRIQQALLPSSSVISKNLNKLKR